MAQSLYRGRAKCARAFGAAAVALAALAAGCGSTPQARPARRVALPSAAVLRQLLPQRQRVVKTAAVRFPGQPPEELVVAASPPATPSGLVGALNVALAAWDAHTRHWHIVWNSPTLAVQRGVEPGHPVMPPLSAWAMRRSAQGVLVGLLSPASLGASDVWNDGLMVWVPPGAPPKTLWAATTSRQQMVDGTITRTERGLLVSQNVCSAVSATQTQGRARVSRLSCTALLKQIRGQRVLFAAGARGVQTATPALSVAAGTTLVFWPANGSTASLVNSGRLGLYGGSFGSSVPAGQVPLDAADTVSLWSYEVSAPGTYRFAIVPAAATSGFTAPAVITVHVTG